MVWPLIGMAALSFAGSLYSSNRANSAANSQAEYEAGRMNESLYRQWEQDYKNHQLSVAETGYNNRIIAQTNALNAEQLRRQVGSMLTQNATIRDQAARTYAEAEKAAQAAGSTATAEAAGAAVKGASVEHVQQDINRELQQSHVDTTRTAQAQRLNLRNEIRSAIERTKAGYLHPRMVSSIAPTLHQVSATTSEWDLSTAAGTAAFGAASAFMSQYFSSQIQYGA